MHPDRGLGKRNRALGSRNPQEGPPVIRQGSGRRSGWEAETGLRSSSCKVKSIDWQLQHTWMRLSTYIRGHATALLSSEGGGGRGLLSRPEYSLVIKRNRGVIKGENMAEVKGEKSSRSKKQTQQEQQQQKQQDDALLHHAVSDSNNHLTSLST